jgi:penicillin amidase
MPAAAPADGREPRLKRALLWLGAGLLGLLVLLLAALLWYRQASLPAYEGTLQVRGIAAPVQIRRDAQGIPRITGASEAEVLFGLGYAHAQDRLWQMDFNRRIAQGRLAELVGSVGLDTDRFLRTLGIPQAAQALLDAMDAETRALLDAYVAGVNAALATRSGPLPPEFLLTRSPRPEPWTARDSMGWAMLMALDLSPEWRDELARLRLATRFSLAEINDLRPGPGTEPVPATADYPAQYRLMGLFKPAAAPRAAAPGATGAADLVAGLEFGIAAGLGSNSWAVAGAHTSSGKPLLAADPHLGLTTPTVWYFAALDAPDLNVTGATLPGMPWVLIGRNARIAWGATAAYGDGVDFYIERRHPTDPALYQTPDGWAAFEERRETIKVRGADDVELVVRSTRHGPVMSGVLGPVDARIDDTRHVLALRWAAVASAASDRTVAALRALNRAAGGAEAQAALAGWTLTQTVFTFADAQGSIGQQYTGRHPLRSPAHDLHGLAPAPGWDARYDWTGLIEPAQLPRLRDPPRGWLVAANHNGVPAGYPHALGHDHAPPFRAQRIEQLLAARQGHDVKSMQAIQTDLQSLAARALIAAVGELRPQTEAGRVALARLQAWDGTMSASAPEPLLFHAWQRKLRLAVFADDLGDLAAHTVERSEMTQALLNVLAGRAGARDWCDRQDTPRVETCAELAAEALDAAVAELAQASGRDVLGLRWGDAHAARLEHRPLSSVVALRSLFEHRVAVGGDTHSPAVAALSPDPQTPFVAVHGAGARMVFDLGGDGGSWILSTGQSGHPASDHYGDQLPLWQHGRYLPVKSASRPERQLILQPVRRP